MVGGEKKQKNFINSILPCGSRERRKAGQRAEPVSPRSIRVGVVKRVVFFHSACI